jgi:predicted ribosomally synthesized peptide with nif11-like leader
LAQADTSRRRRYSMSREAAAEFLMRVRGDSKLQAELGPSPSSASYIEKAGSHGLQVSAEELRGVIAAERFYQKASDDPVLFKRVNGAADEAAVVAIASELGFDCDVQDLKAVLRPHATQSPDGELSDEDLESVAGGGFGFPNVCKTPAPPAPFVPIPYPSWP